MVMFLYIMDILRSLGRMRGRACHGCDDVVFVRYIMATAYLPDSLCGKVYRMVSRILPMPDVAILVDVDPSTAMARITGRGEEREMFETAENLEKVRRRMMSLSDGWIVVENSDDMEGLRFRVLGAVFGNRP